MFPPSWPTRSRVRSRARCDDASPRTGSCARRPGLRLAADVVTVYTERDVALYALTVGAAEDPLDSEDLPLVYELTDEFRVLPTFAVVFPFAGMAAITEVRWRCGRVARGMWRH